MCHQPPHGHGETAGLDLLKRIVDLRIFLELWFLRTRGQ